MPNAQLEGVNAPIREWKHLTGAEFRDMDRRNTVVLLTVSPLEVHGPHLPTITDSAEGEGLLLRAVELLHERRPELQFLHLPPIYVASDVVPQPGSVAFRSSTIVRVLEDLGRSLCKQGFRRIWMSNFHGGPRHFVPMELAAHRVNKKYGGEMVSVFSLLLNQLTGGETDLSNVLGHLEGLSKAELEGDSHGGAIETSMMLHLAGRHVDPGFRELAWLTINIKRAEAGLPPLDKEGERPTLGELLGGFKYKIKYYEDETYAGKPSIASADIGAAIIDHLANLCAEQMVRLIDGALSPADCYSPLWKARWLFTWRPVGWLFEKAVGFRSQVF